MTAAASWRGRYVTAARLKQPEQVPVVLGVGPLWAMRYSGAASWEMFCRGKPDYVDVYIDMVRHFDFCGWLCMNFGDSRCEGASRPPVWTDEVVEEAPDYLRVRYTVRTDKGALTKLSHFPRNDAPWDIEPLVKDPEADCGKVLALLSEDPWERDTSPWLRVRENMGDHVKITVKIDEGADVEQLKRLDGMIGSFSMNYSVEPGDLAKEEE